MFAASLESKEARQYKVNFADVMLNYCDCVILYLVIMVTLFKYSVLFGAI